MTGKRPPRGFTLIELIVVIAIISVLAATILPQVTNVVYKARVASTAASLRSLKDALDMLVTTIGVKPSFSGGLATDTDDIGLLRRSSVPPAYQNLWAGCVASGGDTHRHKPNTSA